MSNISIRPVIDGLELEKGTVLTEQYVLKNQETIQMWLDFFLAYPDIFIDMITPQESTFRLFFYQRITLRAMMRFRYTFFTFTRAYSKSFLAILSRILRCIFLPNTKSFICADIKASGVKIANEKLDEIFRLFPLLEGEVLARHKSNDYVDVVFRNGSMFDVVGTTQGTRGIRRTDGILEEAALLDGDEVNERVLPTLNISRRDVLGQTYPDEPSQAQSWITSAGPKACYAYEQLINFTIMSILSPETAFVSGGDYRVPVAAGLLNKSYIEDIKMSSTFKAESFSREYMSVWTGASSESWIDSDRLARYRKLLKAERKAHLYPDSKDQFYLISVDVGRYSANTVICVFRVNPQDLYFKKSLVYIEVMHDAKFNDQAIRVKQLTRDFNPREVVIDGNGLGAGLSDALTDTNVDSKTAEIFPPMGVINDENYTTIQDPSLPKILYILKANPQMNSEIHSNFYSQVTSGHCVFLAHERDARGKLMATKKGQKMTPKERTQFLMPYEMTSRLFDEISNLKIKSTGNTLEVERISTRVLKDRFSSFEYGLYRIKEYEIAYYKKRKRAKRDLSKMNLFTPATKLKKGGMFG